MSAAWEGRPPPGDDTGPADDGAGHGAVVSWGQDQGQDMAAVCPMLYLAGVGPIQTRSTRPWTPALGRRLRADAARRLPPLASGHRDPDAPRSDAPDASYGRADADLWDLAAQLADPADEAAEDVG